MMTLATTKDWFSQQGLPFEWRTDLAKEAILTPPAGTLLPIGDVEVAIVIPDVHLGWGNDVFQFNDPQRARRLESFLDVLAQLRDRVQNFTAIQLGDWYDFWRAPAPTEAEKRALIERQYPGVYARASTLPLLHCIGNHDSAFYADVPAPKEISVSVVRTIGTPAMMCFHGHDSATVRDIVIKAAADQAALQLVNGIDTLVPVLGPAVSWVQMAADDSKQDPWIDDPSSKPWPAAVVPGPPGWSAPWVARDGAVDLGSVIRDFETATGQRVSVAIIGHSHRPGITWAPVTAMRRVAIVDVGSWTYGRAEFAVVCADGVGLAYLL